MLNASLISLIFGLVIVLVLVLGALWGFLAGLKRELKCLAVFVVVIGLMWIIFGSSASIDKNVILGLSSTVNGILGTPAECTTWREIALYFGQNNLGLKEILIEGTETYSLFMNVISMVVRGVYLIIGTVVALGLAGLIRLISHIVELVIRSSKKKKADKQEPETPVVTEEITEPVKKTPRISMKYRLWGAGVGFVKSLLIVILICVPVTILTGVSDNLSEKSENALEEVMIGGSVENSMVDWIFDITESLDNNIFVTITKPFSKGLFDGSFKVKTDEGVVYLRTELNKLLEIADMVLPTYDKTKGIPFDIWALEEAELDVLFDALAESKLVKSAIPVALEFVGQMDNIQEMLKPAGLKNLNEFVQQVDWENDLVPLLQTIKKALKVVNLNEKLDVMNLSSEALKDLINTLGDTTFFKKLMPVAIDVALSMTVIKNFAGDVDINGQDLTLDWKNELVNLVDVYEKLQALNIDLNNVNLQWLADITTNEADFAVLSEALEKLTVGGLFNEVLVPVLDNVIQIQLKNNNLKEFEGLLSITKMESSDWGHDLPTLLEMVGLLSKLGVLSNDIKLNDYDTMHELIDAFFELIILTDKVKISIDSADLKTLVVEAALRQFNLLDVEGLKFELLELRSEIDWNIEKNNLHKLIDTLENFSETVNEVQGFEITKIADFGALDFNALLASDRLWDDVLDLLDSVVDSKLISSALPHVFEKFISPIIFQVNGEIGEIGLFEKITAENVVAELYNLVYLALDLKEIGIFDVDARSSLEFNFGATAFVPERGFHQSEYFTYEPKATDLALSDIVERIFASAILKGREGRFFRIILAGTLGVNVSVDELTSINYSTEGSKSEKQVLIEGINTLKPVLKDPDFKLYVTDSETGTRSLNINYFLEKDNLGIILKAVEILLDSQIITYLAPEVYNQILVAKGTIPADWANILKVQSTYLELTDGIDSNQLKEDILSLIILVEEVVKLGVADIANAEKAKDVRIEDLITSVDLVLDTVIDLNIIDGKVGAIINKLIKDNAIELETTNLNVVDWDSELTYVKNIIGHVGSIAEYTGFVVYGDVQDFLSAETKQLSQFLSMSTVYEVGDILIEIFNTEVLYDIIHGYVFDKLLADNINLKSMLSADFYTSEMFRRDTLILADVCYQLATSGLVFPLGTFFFPELSNLNAEINLGQKEIAYLLEDIFSLYLLDNAAYGIFDALLKMLKIDYDPIDLINLQLANEYVDTDSQVFLKKATVSNEFSLYNESLPVDDIFMFGDAFLIKRFYMSLFPIFNGAEFPIKDTQSLKNFMGAFNAEKIEEYKKSESLNEYALALADALDIFADMSIATLAVKPVMSIVANTNIPVGTTTVAEMLAIDEEYTKYDFLYDVDTIADIVRDAVEFGLLDSLLKDASIEWTKNEIYAQNLIKDVFRLKVLEANIETFVDMAASMMTNGQVEITLAGDVDLVRDGQKIANAYPYLAEVLENTLGIKTIASLSTLQINPSSFLTTDAASNILDAVREIITLSVIEASLPGVAEALQNTNLQPAIKELFSLTDITSAELLAAIADVTYPAKELVKLNVLDLLQQKDISLENIDDVPSIIERILTNKYISTKYASLLEVVRLYLGISVNAFDAYNLDWDYETTELVGLIEDAVQVIQNCGFKTANDLIDLTNGKKDVKECLTSDNLKEIVSILKHVVSSNIVEGLGGGIYQEKLLPSYKETLDSTMYNLIKVDEEYTVKTLFNDLRKVVNALDVVVDGDIAKIIFEDAEIDYVGITPDVKDVLNAIFGLEFLDAKTEYIYAYLAKMSPTINIDYIEYQNLDFVSDAETLGKAYELVAPLLDSGVNPYQKVSAFANKDVKVNLAEGTEAEFIGAINSLKAINNTTLVTVNNPLIVSIAKQMVANADTSTIMGLMTKELFDISLDNGEHRVVSDILHDDINTILDACIKEIEAGAIDALADIQNYDLTASLLPTEIEVIKDLLDLRFFTELKGQDLLEVFMSIFGINDRLDFTTLTYESETSILKEIMDLLPSFLEEINCKSYADIINFYDNMMNDMALGQLDYKTILTKGNLTNVISVLEILKDSETLKQAAVPLYQAILHPYFEQTNDEGFIQFTHIDETIYTNDKFISDYSALVDMLIKLNEFGIYDIVFNDGEIDWSNGELVETVLNSTIGLNIFEYKEKQLIKSIVHTMSKTDANMSLIASDIIRLSQDKELLIEAYKALIPVLTKESFPWRRLSDFAADKKATIYIRDYTDKETLKSIISAVEALNNTTLNEGTIAYTLNMVKAIFNNEAINNILSYQNRGLTNKDVVADINTLLEDGGTVKLLIDAGIVDFFFGTDINIILPEVYENVIRDVFNLNILNGQYAEVVKLVAGMMGLDVNQIKTSVLNADTDEEALVALVKDAVALLEINGFTTFTSLSKLMNQTLLMDYFTTENLKEVADIIKDTISLTLGEAILPAYVNSFSATYLVEVLRPLAVFDDYYTYADLRSDYNDYLYPMINDLLDFGLVGIIKHNDIIDWDKQKADNTYYVSSVIKEALSIKYLETKKATLYKVFLEAYYPGVDIDRIVFINEIENVTTAYEKALPVLTSAEWPYNTFTSFVEILTKGFDVSALYQSNVDILVDALRSFEDSVLLEEVMGPVMKTLNFGSWVDFSVVVNANAELAEYARILNVLDKINELGALHGSLDTIKAEELADLIDMIFGNETVTPAVEGLMCIADEGYCIKMLYSYGLLPSVAGIEPNVDAVAEDKWHEEIIALSNIIHSLGAFCPEGQNTIDPDSVINDLLKSTDVKAVEEVLTNLNNSTLYREVLYYAMAEANNGPLSNYTTDWFSNQANGAMNDEWDQEVIILARLYATINSLGGIDILDIDNYQTIGKGYATGNAATDATYTLEVNGEKAGLRQIYQLLCACKTYDIEPLKAGIELYLAA